MHRKRFERETSDVHVYIDKNLSWSVHIDHLCSVISSKISLLKQLATYVPAKLQKVKDIYFLL